MRYRMNLQLFDDGGGAGSGNQGGNAGTGNGGQGSAGSASGAHGTGTYTYEQLEEIAGARVERSERTALANFFRNQGMTESEVTQAINNFKAERAANQPKTLSGKGVRSEDLDYVMFKVSKLVDDKTTFEKAADKFLKENPKFTGNAGSYRISTSSGNSSEGSGGNMNASINDRIRAAARR